MCRQAKYLALTESGAGIAAIDQVIGISMLSQKIKVV